MKKIKVGNTFALVDDQDFESLNQFKWHQDKGYAYGYVEGKHIYMHSLILNTPKGLFSDHINRNRLDNRRENLRIVSHAENNQNRTIGLKSHIYFDKIRKRFFIQIRHKTIGHAKTFEEGIKIRDNYLGMI